MTWAPIGESPLRIRVSKARSGRTTSDARICRVCGRSFFRDCGDQHSGCCSLTCFQRVAR